MNENLKEWFNKQRENTPDEMYYKNASSSQIIFARDSLCALISRGMPTGEGYSDEDRLLYEKKRGIVTVICQHISKSVALPVYNFDRSDIGLRMIMRNNFYDWKLSVISDIPINADFDGLFHTNTTLDPGYTGNELLSCYFEGFPEDLVFGYYDLNNSIWSASIGGDNALWTVLFLIMKARGQIKPFKWEIRK